MDIGNSLLERVDSTWADWLKHSISLCVVALSILIGMKSSYLSGDPCAVWLVKASWMSFCIAILSGSLLLYAMTRRARALAVLYLLEVGRNPQISKPLSVPPFPWESVARISFLIAFVSGFSLVTIFAVLNS